MMNLTVLQKQIEYAFSQRDKLNTLITLGGYEQFIFLGNGGSNSIASHISQDYAKQLGKKTLCFSDASRLTCYINDYGMEHAYQMFIEHNIPFMQQRSNLVILISSSGNSNNILNAAKYCESKGIDWLSLTGFDDSNALKTFASTSKHNQLNLWIHSKDYGVVECVHEIFLHSILGGQDNDK